MACTNYLVFELPSDLTEQLSPTLFNKICRVCLSTIQLTVIHEANYDNINLCDIFRECASVQVEINDGLPQNICNSCIDLLIQAYEFKQRCHHTNLLLRSLLNEEDSISNVASITQKIPLEAIEDDKELHSEIDKPEFFESSPTGFQENSPAHRDSFICKCNKNFNSIDGFKMHKCKYTQSEKTYKTGMLFPCKVCEKRFQSKSTLRRHMMIHTGEKPYKCDVCDKDFNQLTALQTHQRTHTGETPFFCDYCGKTFRQSFSHKMHLRRHEIANGSVDENLFECNICQHKFTTKQNLKAHIFRHREKLFLCSFCGRTFNSKDNLINHSRVHTGERPYSCPICNKSYQYSINLKTHMLLHTGQKPFVCNICSKAFSQQPHLKYHMQTHSGEKPHSCSYCGKSFAVKSNLTVHIRQHTGETPYVCDICDKGFYHSSSMKKHRQGHVILENS